MPLVTVADIIEESGLTYSNLGFSNQTDFEAYIQKRLEWIAGKVLEMVGSTNYVASKLDVKMGEIYWTLAAVLIKRRAIIAASVEGGFAIGSLRIDNPAKASNDLATIAQSYFDKAMTQLTPYASITYHRYLVIEDEEEVSVLSIPPDRYYLRYRNM